MLASMHGLQLKAGRVLLKRLDMILCNADTLKVKPEVGQFVVQQEFLARYYWYL